MNENPATMDDSDNVTLRDVYDLVQSMRKELREFLENDAVRCDRYHRKSRIGVRTFFLPEKPRKEP